MKKFLKISAALMFLSLPLACLAQDSRHVASGWSLFKNNQQGYCLKVPPQLKIALKKERDRKFAVENRLPFDYINFRPREETGGFGLFELGVGVHWNRDNLGSREFADKKDEGLTMGGARIVTVSQTEVTVAHIKGVRDDFRMLKPEGWKSYARIIIPYNDKFFVFLCTLGKERPLADNEKVFQGIVDSFDIENQKNP